MKRDLLECLVRECVIEVLEQKRKWKKVEQHSTSTPNPSKKEPEDKPEGEPAEPAEPGAEPTTDAPEVPAVPGNRMPGLAVTTTQLPGQVDVEEPEGDFEKTLGSGLRGIVVVSPHDPANVEPLNISPDLSDVELDRTLHDIAARQGGSKVKVAQDTLKAVKHIVRHPDRSIYLYFGKFDPESEEVFLMADLSLHNARASTVGPGEVGPRINQTPDVEFDPTLAEPENYEKFAHAGLANQGIDEQLIQTIHRMVNEVLR